MTIGETSKILESKASEQVRKNESLQLERILIEWGIILSITAILVYYYFFGVERGSIGARMSLHNEIIKNKAVMPYNRRVLTPFIAEALIRCLSPFVPYRDSFIYSYLIYDGMAIFFTLFLMLRYLNDWFTGEYSLFGVAFMALSMIIALRNHYYQPWSLLEMAFLIYGLILIRKEKMHLLALITAFAALNRETSYLIPASYFFVNIWDKENRKNVILNTAIFSTIWLAVYVLLTIARSQTPYIHTMEELWRLNINHLPYATINISLFLGLFWIFSILGWRSTNKFLKRLVLLIPTYLPSVILLGVWHEVRLLMPLYPIIIPLALSFISTTARAKEDTMDSILIRKISAFWKNMKDFLASFKLNKENLIKTVFVSFFCVVLVRNAWLCDDAYITFRTVDNFVNGYGLTWNTAERVQAYSNPLWMFLLSLLYFFTREIYYTSILFSVAVSVAAVILLAFRVASSLGAALFIIVALSSSKAFIDYSTSGLENPLTHLVLAIFILVYLKSEINLKTFRNLSLIASIGAFNRADTIFLFLPTLLYLFWKLPKLKALRNLIVGFLPFIVWECFSLFYYGSLFPNPFYAKLYTGISRLELIKQGLWYLSNSLDMDPLTLSIIVSGIVAPFLIKERRYLPIAGGAVLYVLFVVNIGGCFMSGRYLTAPMFLAVFLLSSYFQRMHATFAKLGWLLVFILIILASLSSPYSPLISDESYNNQVKDAHGIADERGYYYQATCLLKAISGVEMPNHNWAAEGKAARNQGISVVVVRAIGFYGFYAGPKVYVVDQLALADPLLARLPARENPGWRIGHFDRMIPRGYLETLVKGQNLIKDRNLAAYYEKLRIITQGNLFDLNRLILIFELNLGKYDYLVDYEYYRTGYKFIVDISEINEPQSEGTPWNHPDNFLISKTGIKIILEKQRHNKRIEISLDNNDDYLIVYLSRDVPIANQTIPAHIIPSGGLAIHIIDVPKVAFEKGYDSIKVIPLRGDGMYSIGHIRLLDEK